MQTQLCCDYNTEAPFLVHHLCSSCVQRDSESVMSIIMLLLPFVGLYLSSDVTGRYGFSDVVHTTTATIIILILLLGHDVRIYHKLK